MRMDLDSKLVEFDTDKERIKWLKAIIRVLEDDITERQDREDELRKKLIAANYKEKNERKAGRKKRGENEETGMKIFKIVQLMDKGYSNKQIMEELNMSQAAFYRYKKLL